MALRRVSPADEVRRVSFIRHFMRTVRWLHDFAFLRGVGTVLLFGLIPAPLLFCAIDIDCSYGVSWAMSFISFSSFNLFLLLFFFSFFGMHVCIQVLGLAEGSNLRGVCCLMPACHPPDTWHTLVA